MWKKLGLSVLVAALSIGASLAQDATAVPDNPVVTSTVASSVVGGDEDSLRAFILRYLGGTMNSAVVNVTIGELSADLPITLPTPSDAVVYSTVARPGPMQANTPSYYDVNFDTQESAQGVIDFYKQALTAPDWKLTSESVSPGQAFTGDSNSYASFCYQNAAATMNINAYDTANNPTSVTVSIQTPGDAYGCATQPGGPVTDQLYSLIPSLALPEAVTVISNMGGGLSYYTPNGRSNSVSAILESTRPLTEIATDYNAQLAAAGWQQSSVENSERTALSTWTVTDSTGKAWHGSLLIVADNTPNLYNALIYVEE